MSAPSWKGVLGALAIFSLGLAVGVAGTVVVGKRALRNAFAAGAGGREAGTPGGGNGLIERGANRVGADIAKRLDLDRDEASRVQTELSIAAGRLRLIRLTSARQLREELRSTVQRIEASLPAEKRPEFRKIVAERFDRLGVEVTQPAANEKLEKP